MAVSAIAQVGAMITMLYCVEHAAFEHKDEVDATPNDEEVLAQEEREAQHLRLYAGARTRAAPEASACEYSPRPHRAEIMDYQAGEVPAALKALLWVGAVCTTAAVFGSTVFSRRCFGDFSLYPSFDQQVDENLDGSWLNIIKGPGWIVIGLLVAALACRGAVVLWADVYVAREERRGRKPKRGGLRGTVSLMRKSAIGRAAGTLVAAQRAASAAENRRGSAPPRLNSLTVAAAAPLEC
jgi:hypothetical protein